MAPIRCAAFRRFGDRFAQFASGSDHSAALVAAFSKRVGHAGVACQNQIVPGEYWVVP